MEKSFLEKWRQSWNWRPYIPMTCFSEGIRKFFWKENKRRGERLFGTGEYRDFLIPFVTTFYHKKLSVYCYERFWILLLENVNEQVPITVFYESTKSWEFKQFKHTLKNVYLMSLVFFNIRFFILSHHYWIREV